MFRDAATGTASEARSVIDDALDKLEENAHQQTDGIWLQEVTTDVAPHVRDWNIDGCWSWENWPDRDDVMPEGTPPVDVGIDLVGRRRDDRRWIAIQVKSRKLNLRGEGERITSGEINKVPFRLRGPQYLGRALGGGQRRCSTGRALTWQGRHVGSPTEGGECRPGRRGTAGGTGRRGRSGALPALCC